MKPDATLKPDLTLEHVLAAAVARRVTDGTVAAPTCRVMAYQAALEGFRLGISTSAQLLAGACHVRRIYLSRAAAPPQARHAISTT